MTDEQKIAYEKLKDIENKLHSVGVNNLKREHSILIHFMSEILTGMIEPETKRVEYLLPLLAALFQYKIN
jgi:hypothetical protein